MWPFNHTKTNDLQQLCRSHDNVNDIIDALTKRGFYAGEIRADINGLADCPKPAIIQTTTKFLVVVQSDRTSVTIVENQVKYRIAYLDFIKMWTGIVIIIEPIQSSILNHQSSIINH
jgi:ABC-type bacteriocin/lantibiotic exporter with double-glycine peptidase domain